MWIWMIILAVIVGTALSSLGSNNNQESGLSSLVSIGCMVGNCLQQLAFAGISIIAVLWLFDTIVGLLY